MRFVYCGILFAAGVGVMALAAEWPFTPLVAVFVPGQVCVAVLVWRRSDRTRAMRCVSRAAWLVFSTTVFLALAPVWPKTVMTSGHWSGRDSSQFPVYLGDGLYRKTYRVHFWESDYGWVSRPPY